MAAPQIRFLIKADGAPDAVAALRTIREEEQRLAKAEKESAEASKKGNADRQSGLKGLLSPLMSVNSTLMSVKGFLAGALIASMFAFGKATFDAAVEFDSLSRGLKAALPAGADLNAELKALEQTAKMPGLGFKEAIELSTRLQSSGMSADKARKAMEAFGNALATVGKGKADLEGVGLALMQIQAKGKVSAEEINQIAERVPQIRAAMERAFGTSNTEILQKANIDAKEFVDTIVVELGRLPKVTGGMKNDLENLDDNWFKLKKTIGDTFAPSVAAAIGEVNGALEWHDGVLVKATATAFKWGLEWSVKGLAGMAISRMIDGFRSANQEAKALGETLDSRELKGKPIATREGQKKVIDQAIGASAGGSVAGLYGGGGFWKDADGTTKSSERIAGEAEKSIQDQESLRKQLRISHKKDKEELIAAEMALYKRRIEMAHGSSELITEIEKQHQATMADINKGGHKVRAKQIRDYADEIIAAQKSAADAHADAENVIQQEMIRTQESTAKRQYEIGEMTVDEFYRGRKDALEKQQAANQARLSGHYSTIMGQKGMALSGSDLLDAAMSAKMEIQGQVTSTTAGQAGEQNVKRLQQIKDIEKLIAEIVKEQEASKRDIAATESQRLADAYGVAAKKMQEDLDRVNAAKQAQMDKLSEGKQDTFTTDANIANIQLRNMFTLRADLQAMSDTAVTDEQRAAVQAMTTAFKDWGVAINTTKVAMDQFKLSIGDLMVSGITEFLMNFATQQKSIGQAALDMAQSFVQSVLQMITQALVMKVIFSAMDLPIPGGSLASAIGFSGGGSVQKKADGGAIFGEGTGTSDSIPALLSNGEHVWTAAEVRAAGGHGAVYAMRSAIRTGSRYAEGGAIGDASGAALNVSGSSSAMLNVGLDRGLVAELVDEHISGPGMKTIIKGTSRNAKAMKTAMGG